jgi:hypothetical protein
MAGTTNTIELHENDVIHIVVHRLGPGNWDEIDLVPPPLARVKILQRPSGPGSECTLAFNLEPVQGEPKKIDLKALGSTKDQAVFIPYRLRFGNQGMELGHATPTELENFKRANKRFSFE